MLGQTIGPSGTVSSLIAAESGCEGERCMSRLMYPLPFSLYSFQIPEAKAALI